MSQPIKDYAITFRSAKQIAEETYACTFSKPADFTFTAGQYVILTIDAPRFEDDRLSFRSLSIASAPYEDELVFIMRGGESAFKRSLMAMAEGEKASIKGPLGHFILPEEPVAPVVFLAAGVGITPIRSMVRQEAHDQINRSMLLIYSNRTPERAACYEEMEQLAEEYYPFSAICTMTDKEPDWPGYSGRVTTAFLRRYVDNVRVPFYYVVGTKGFIEGMKEALEYLQVDPSQIIVDNFG